MQRILDECSRRGSCPLDRKEFDETFAGADLAIQVRAAIDFAQQHDLAFARSVGDQHFVFSRLPKSQERGHRPALNEKRQTNETKRRFGRKPQASARSRRPFGRSF